MRRDDVSKHMEGKWESGPFGGYHRTCYQMYTGKQHLERIVKKRKIDGTLVEDGAESIEMEVEVPLTRSCLQSTDIKQCIICQKEKTDSKDRRRKEKLTLCQTMMAGASLIEAAKVRDDQRLVLMLSDEDPIALEVCYHRSCYRSYTCIKSLVGQKNEIDPEMQMYDEAFLMLKGEMEPKLIEGDVLRMSDLRARYIQLLSEKGVQNPLYRGEKLKARIQKAFSSRVSFWHPKHRSEAEILYYDKIPKGQVVEACFNRSLEDEFCDEYEPMEDDSYIYHTAKTVRTALLNHHFDMPWPPYASDLKEDNISLPVVVYNLLAWILTNDSESQEIPKEEKLDVKEPSIH